MKLLIACLLVAALTATGTEAARRLVTSKDIKNGTIQSVDLSPQLREKKVERVISIVAMLYIGSTGTAIATCPVGTELLSGGYAADNSSIVHLSRPALDGSQAWQASGRYTGDIFMGWLYAHALCKQSPRP